MKITIITPSLEPHDAISIDVLEQRKHLLGVKYQVEIFSEFCHDSIRPLLATKEHVIQCLLEPDNLLIYHHSIYWELGEKIFQLALCSIIMKFHNISPSFFFEGFDPLIFRVTQQGRKQTARLINSGKIKWFVGDSQYNVDELIHCGVNKKQCSVIPPFNLLQDFENTTPATKIEKTLKEFDYVNLLFVGRIVPNKGHLHLIRTLNSYVNFYGTNVRLHLVGEINPRLGKYYQLLENEINKYKLGELIIIHQKVDLKTLHTLYQSADVFLLLSEHEGFCVPILEAQYHHLPIIAWDQCAVGETLGKGGLLFQDCDYDAFAVAIHRLTSDKELKHHLIQNGIKNLKQYHKSIILKKTLTTLDI